MGIDKPDVRWVFHYESAIRSILIIRKSGAPDAMTKQSRALLFYVPKDLNVHRFFSGGGGSKRRCHTGRSRHSKSNGPHRWRSLQEDTELSRTKLNRVLHSLQDAGAVTSRRTAKSRARSVAQRQQSRARRGAKRGAAAPLRAFAPDNDAKLRRGFGLPARLYSQLLRRRIRCTRWPLQQLRQLSARHQHETTEPSTQPFPINSRVQHAQWGAGEVLRYEADKMVVLFDTVGYKTLGVEWCCRITCWKAVV
jgi:ATP-dependent DNA helicase RecQ